MLRALLIRALLAGLAAALTLEGLAATASGTLTIGAVVKRKPKPVIVDERVPVPKDATPDGQSPGTGTTSVEQEQGTVIRRTVLY
ncbi:hypothetical protein GCM10028813_01500 [Ramlibacter alkalitolerans]